MLRVQRKQLSPTSAEHLDGVVGRCTVQGVAVEHQRFDAAGVALEGLDAPRVLQVPHFDGGIKRTRKDSSALVGDAHRVDCTNMPRQRPHALESVQLEDLHRPDKGDGNGDGERWAQYLLELQ